MLTYPCYVTNLNRPSQLFQYIFLNIVYELTKDGVYALAPRHLFLHSRLRSISKKDCWCQTQFFYKWKYLKYTPNEKTYSHLDPDCFTYPMKPYWRFDRNKVAKPQDLKIPTSCCPSEISDQRLSTMPWSNLTHITKSCKPPLWSPLPPGNSLAQLLQMPQSLPRLLLRRTVPCRQKHCPIRCVCA